MTMQIVERIISNGHGHLDAGYLVIHETANPGATAANHVSYWSNNPNAPMTHYVADWTDTVYHTVPDDRICWHVGNGNDRTVGIELCHAVKVTDFLRVWETGVLFAAWYLNKRGWGIDRLISHNDARLMWGGTDHTDPAGADGKSGYFGQFGRTWEQFKSEVETELAMADIDYQRLADRIVDTFMRYKLTGDNGYTADIGQRICRMDDKTQAIVNSVKNIEKQTK